MKMRNVANANVYLKYFFSGQVCKCLFKILLFRTSMLSSVIGYLAQLHCLIYLLINFKKSFTMDFSLLGEEQTSILGI